ncbi:hypothetical protein HNR76_002100 [Pseudoxanthomonas broegbernensis]|uniref:hypothetical protein n=1 Tax=Pseudoxanthomonas broegbernensis TaxID=83619 RepID=UPI00160D5FA9|nr:hypothetical protein [Pseudoxanthomonas broegbernensis]MBB6065534.1 hypothetical protein [Pseudoxanthomonas broegbernensis]
MPTRSVPTLLPTFEPLAMASPCSSCSCPPASAARVSIKVAWLDGRIMVTTSPPSANS